MRNTLLSKNAFRSLFWCFALMFLLNVQNAFGQTDIIPKLYLTARNVPSGNTNWTFTNATINNAGTDYWKMIAASAGSVVTSPVMNFSGYTSITISVITTSFGTVVNNSDYLKLEYYNGSTWSQVAFGKGNPTFASPISLPYSYTNAQIRLTATNATGSAGARLTSVQINGIASTGTASPTLTADATSNTVDNPIDITFTDDSAWRTAVTAVKIGTTTLTTGTDYDLTAGNLQLKPSGLNALLTTSGSKSVTIVATGYTDATVTQVINAGVPTANSTATISAALAQNATRTITCTAKDQYNNLVSGYTFAYDVIITNNDNTTAESYTINGSPFTTTSTSGNPVVATTNVSGVATFDTVLPTTIDSSDGINIQVQLNNDTTNIGSAFSFTQLASQTITFDALSPVTYGDAAFGLTATASSTLPVTYTSSNTTVATVSGSTVTIVGAGSTNITASQAGNGSYNAASNVIQSLTVNAIALTLPDAAATNKVYTGTNTAVITGTITGIINSDNVTLIGTGTFADVNVANGIAVTSTSTLGGTKAGNYILTQPTGLMADITQATQTITFGALANKTIGDADYSPGATSATSGINPISYTSSNLAVATIVANEIHIVGVGTTNITAIQDGSSNYSAANSVVQPLLVVSQPIAAWQFGSPAALGTEVTYSATSNHTNLETVILSRGNGIAATALGRAFGSNAWGNGGTKTTAENTNEYFEFAINVKPGHKLFLTTLDATIRRSGATAPNAYIWKYSTDGTTFTEIGTDISYIGTSEGVSQPQIDLSGISALQNVENATSLTFRLYAWGGTSTTSTFSIGRYGTGVTTNSLAIGGDIELISTTWNGTSWSNGAPSASIDAIIEGPYSTATNGIFTTKKVTVNSGSLTINSNTNLTIQNELINNLTAADVVVENNANLIQVNAIANTGNITVNRNSASLMRQDYTLWSSPVSGQQLQAFSPATLANRFYTYNPTTNFYAAEPATTNFTTGKGYLIRMPNDHPTIATIWSGTFTGIPNNGTVTIPVTLGTYNAVGNPYPSAIDADAFITDNNITEALYFWRKTNNAISTSYATYTKAGGAGTTSPNSGDPLGIVPNGIIQVGQGFITKSTSNSLSFTNTMKVADNANQFLRTSTIERNRIWLNLTNTAGLFSQTMVAYMTNATSGIDSGIDGHIFNDTQTALTSVINTEEFAIQGRALPFAASDIVPLGFKSELVGNYSIAIDHVDGLFTGGQTIYLKDHLTNTTHNLSTGNYTFATAAGVFNTRFEIVYQNLLSVNLPTFNENSVVVYKANGEIHINAGAVIMDHVKIYDISGRLLAKKSKVNASETTVDSSKFGTQVLIVQITSDTQIKVSKKVVN